MRGFPFSASISRLWARFWLRGVSFRSRYDKLEMLYAIDDPWNLKSSREQTRFAACNALIADHSSGCGTLLEVGCGEGLQTAWLQRACGKVTGLEVSDAALRRARQRCPGAELHHGRIEDLSALLPGRRFDVVTAFEVLYYIADVGAALAVLQDMGDVLLVTNYEKRAGAVAAHFGGPGWTRLDDIAAEGTVWHVHLWKRPADPS